MKYFRWPTKITLYLCIAIFSILSIMNIYEYRKTNTIKYLVPVIFLVLALYFILKKVKPGHRTFILALFFLSFVSKSVLVLFLKTEPISDFSLFWSAAKNIANAQTDYLQLGYFKVWSYQMGIVTYYAGLIKILGDNVLIAQIINCIWVALTNVLVYLLAKKVSNDIAARTIAILYLIYPEPYFLCSTLSNQMLGDLLLCFAVYVFFKERNLKNTVLAGIIAAFGNAVRPSGGIMILAVVFFAFIGFADNISGSTSYKMSFIKVWGQAAAAISMYFIVGVILSSLMIYSGLNPNGLKNGFALYKFVVGLNHTTLGEYSNEDAKLTSISDKKLRNEISINLIKERMQFSPSSLFYFFKNKTENMWVDYDTLGWSFFRLTGGYIDIASIRVPFQDFSDFILRLEKSFYIIMLALSALSCIVCIKRKQTPPAFLFILLVFIFYFIMQEFIEIQVRYRYFAMTYIFIVSSKSLESIEEIRLEC